MNHVIIGLGGTGGKIIRAFRKQIYGEFRKESIPGVSVGYLYVDSSSEMMSADDPSWKILGTSVQLPVGSQLKIVGEDLKSRLDNIQTYPGIKPWIGDRAEWNEILNSIIGAALGGQKRRLGRFLFACKIDDFNKALQNQVRNVQANGQTDLTFHVIAGLAGGTGSGSLIDVVAQIRAQYSDPRRHRIILYLLNPEQFPLPSWDTGNYHANGYAALTEINALSTGAYQPYDVKTGNRLDLKDAFNGAYVFGNENEKGYIADVDVELPSVVADFLFQKIVVADQVGWRSLERMENAENGDGTPETAPGARVGERSKRFLSFGIKRIAIPEEEIGEYLSLSFARQAINQLRFNNWQEGQGFVDRERNVDTASFVRETETLGRWLLSDAHILLSTAILAADDKNKRWRTLTNEWEEVIATFKGMVREGAAPGWLDELHSLCAKRFDEGFRNTGVVPFFRVKTLAKREMAREIRSQVETELFDDWRNATRSASEISRVLADLMSLTTDRLTGSDSQIQKERDASESAGAELVKIHQRWADLGLFGKLVGKRDALLDAYAIQLQEHYVRRTRVEAWVFAKSLLGEVLTELADLKSDVDAIIGTMQEALRRVGAGIDERLKADAGGATTGHIIRFYDPDLVRSVTKTLTVEEAEQATQTSAIRAALVEKLGPAPNFGAFRERLGLSDLIDRIEAVAERNARTAHDILVTESRQKILGVSIIDKLRERFGADRQALRNYVADLVREAGCYLTTNPLEKNRAGPGIPQGVQTLVEKWVVVMPRAPEQSAFVEQLQQAFRDAQPGDLEFITTEGRTNEITMIAIKNLYPLRYLGILPFLETRYEARVRSNPARAGLELHTEGDLTRYPRLFVQSGDEMRKEALALILIARALDVVRVTNGKLTFYGHDDGFEAAPVALGTSLLDAPDAVDHTIQAALRAEVGAGLAKRSDRAEIETSLRAAPDDIKPLVGGDVGDPRYRAVVEAAKTAIAIIRS